MDTTEAAERDRRQRIKGLNLEPSAAQLLQKKRAAAGRIDMPGDVTLPRGDQPVRGMWNTVDEYRYGKPRVPPGRGHGRMSPPTRNGGTATPAASAGGSAAPACSASGGHPAGLQPASFKEPPPIKAGSKAPPPPPPPPRRERRRGGGPGRLARRFQKGLYHGKNGPSAVKDAVEEFFDRQTDPRRDWQRQEEEKREAASGAANHQGTAADQGTAASDT